jgi:hypothetical protein
MKTTTVKTLLPPNGLLAKNKFRLARNLGAVEWISYL